MPMIGAQSHYLGHLDALKPGLTVRQNLDFWRHLWGGGDIEAALDAVGLEPLGDLHAAVLSAGQRRRVALARLLVAPTAAVAARRAGDGARCCRRSRARPADRRSSRRRRHGDRRHPSRPAGQRRPRRSPWGRHDRRLLAIAGQTARLSLKSGGGAFVGLVFFVAVVTVVPFGVGPDLKLLARIGPAMLWIGALLATLLGLDRLFGEDKEDGTLDLLALSGLPLEVTVLAKCAGAWVATALPLVVVSPVLGLLLGMEPAALGVTALTLLSVRRH